MYLSDTAIFADVFNYYIHAEEQIISPGLAEWEPTEIAIPYGADGAAVPMQKFRDTFEGQRKNLHFQGKK